MKKDIHIHIGYDAVEQLTEFCSAMAQKNITIVCDHNTYAALGNRVEDALSQSHAQVQTIMLTGDEIVADEKYLMQVLLQSPPGDQVFLAVGSGTITDITRYISFRTRNPFISVPTAPSVDGFISFGAPLVVNSVKETYPSQPPIAVFADLHTLMNAPSALIASGFADILGKSTSLADWKLAALLWNEPFDPAVEARTHQALEKCLNAVDDIVKHGELGISLLMEALLESGIAMIEFGNSRPASGSEHYCSHYWEMLLLKQQRPALLHGEKVGYAAILIAGLYGAVRNIDTITLENNLDQANCPTSDEVRTTIQKVFGDSADIITRMQAPYLELTEEMYNEFRDSVAKHWTDVLEISEEVLTPEQIAAYLNKFGAPTNNAMLGLDDDDVRDAILYGHYLRRNFTIVKLFDLLGMNLLNAAQR